MSVLLFLILRSVVFRSMAELDAEPVARRDLLTKALGVAALLPLAANAATYQDLGGALPETPEGDAATSDAMMQIALKNQKQLEEEKAKLKQQRRLKTDDELLKDQAQSRNLIVGVAGGGTLLSTFFFKDNIARLATKITSGGEDDGYGTIPPPAQKRAASAPKRTGPAWGRKPPPEPEPEPEPEKSGPFGLW